MLPQLRKLQHQLTKRHQSGNLRSLPATSNLHDFSSNDYLGYNALPEVKEFLKKRTKRPDGLGATGSRLLTGNVAMAYEVETELAEYFQAEACLLFPSGYMANLAVFSALPQRGHRILVDEKIHASIKDGYRLNVGASHQSFQHNNLPDLERKLQEQPGATWVAVESVYSMDGDRAPLAEISRLCRRYSAALVVDEAHSTGLWGPNGAGLCLAESITDECSVRTFTFGKAMGYHGACVVGSKLVIDCLVNFARPFIYSTGQPTEFYHTIQQLVRYRQANNHELNLLWQRVQLYASELQKSKLRFPVNNTPIQVIPLPGNQRVKAAAAYLQQAGFDVRPIVSPTVPAGTERLRICLHAHNQADHITQLVSELSNLPSS